MDNKNPGEKKNELFSEDNVIEISAESQTVRMSGRKKVLIGSIVLLVVLVGGLFVYFSFINRSIDKKAWQLFFDLTRGNDNAFARGAKCNEASTWFVPFDGEHSWPYQKDKLMDLARKDFHAADYDEFYTILTEKYKPLHTGGTTNGTYTPVRRFYDVGEFQDRLINRVFISLNVEEAYLIDITSTQGGVTIEDRFLLYSEDGTFFAVPYTESIKNIFDDIE